MERGSAKTGWIVAYIALLLLPVPLMWINKDQEHAPSTVFALSLGFAAYMGMALQVILASRSPKLQRVAGLDALLRLHRYMGGVLITFVALHVAVLWYKNTWVRPWLYPLHGPFEAQTGWVAMVAMALLGVTSYARRQINLSYESWRMIHIILTVLAVAGAYTHVLIASDYSWSGPLRIVSTVAILVALAALVYLRVGRAFAVAGQPYELVEVRPERGDATTLTLRPVGHSGIAFQPGQFAWLRTAGRPYTLTEHPLSVSSSTSDAGTVAFTARHLGDHTSTFGELTPGNVILVDGPHGGHRAHGDATDGWVLVVAGIGVTPAMSLLRTMADMRDPRPVQVLYGVRSINNATFHDELHELRTVLDLDLHVLPSSVHGRIHQGTLAALLPADRLQRRYLICGPEGFADAMLRALVSLGVEPRRIHAERFDSV
jgi:predicted ferric reductase